MRAYLALLTLFVALLTPLTRGAPAPDSTLTEGLNMCVTNGVETGVRLWYSDRPEMAVAMAAKINSEAGKLGGIIDSEVVAVQPVSKRVTRYYVALYFTGSPLWVRIDRYQSREKSFFLPLKCSTNPDDILPGYITEFYR